MKYASEMEAPSVAGWPPVASETTVCVVILIPAYQPGAVLIDILHALASGVQVATVVVDEGSGQEDTPIFEEIGRLPRVHVIRQPTNLGKDAALKRVITFLLRTYPEVAGIATADADGQHDPADFQGISDQFQRTPDALVLGVRCFAGSIPLRSRLGNRFTRRVLRAVLGCKLSDSQTGLRAIPHTLLHRVAKLRASG
jgi:dolichol-phosphate mannosyltransferase